MYDVLNIDLSVPFVEKPFVDAAKQIGAVTYLIFPVGAQLIQKLGNCQPISVPGAGAFYGFSKTDGNYGLAFTNPVAQPGIVVQVMVGYVEDNSGAAPILIV